MSGEDYIKYLTERFVNFLDTPKAKRKHRRASKQKEQMMRQWFGDVPFSVKLFFNKHKQRLKKY